MDHFFLEFRLYAMVAFGIGLVIFVHELGHFMAARWCGVRVETFSLGFGPAILKRKRGATTYQLSIVPLGGYVKMAGEESVAGSSTASDDLSSKSVGQRFLIFSGGVIMNMVFALVVFPIILMTGVPLPEPVLGDVTPGEPAWQAGLKPGTHVVSVNGNDVYAFTHIVTEVALGSPTGAEFVVVDPGSTVRRSVHVVPKYDDNVGISTIGVSLPMDPAMGIEITPGGAAAQAGLATGDHVISVDGGIPGLSLTNQMWESGADGGPLKLRLRRADRTEYDATITPTPGKLAGSLIGLEPVRNLVKDLRSTPLVQATGLAVGDRILDVNGQKILRPYDWLRALQGTRLGAAPRIAVLRGEKKIELTGPALREGDALALHEDVAVVADPDSSRILTAPSGAAREAGIQDGDRIVRIGRRSADSKDGEAPALVDANEVAKFQDIKDANEKGGGKEPMVLSVLREDAAGTTQTLEFTVTPRPIVPMDYGFSIRDATYLYKASGPIAAVRMGVAASWKFVEESWITLKRILLRQVDSKNLGGIITIGVVSHSWAGEGLAKLFFFLCMLSVNLAFLNVLPVPVLDGGHLFFLLIEKIKGSPVSERVLGYSQMVGIVMIISLMVFVTFHDVMRWIVK